MSTKPTRRNRRQAQADQATPDAIDQAPTPAADAIDHGAALLAALVTFGQAFDHETIDADNTPAVAALQATYRAIPAGARGRHQASAVGAWLASDATPTPVVMGAALQALANLPAASASRTAAPTPTDDQADAIRRLAVLAAADAIGALAPVSDDMRQACQPFAGLVASLASRILSDAGALPMGSRQTFDMSVSDMLAAGILTPGASLTTTYRDATYNATIDASGALVVDGVSYASPSAAARAATGQASVNGWQAWSHDGVSLASLRRQPTPDQADA